MRLLGGARGVWAPTGKERGGGILCRHAHSLLHLFLFGFASLMFVTAGHTLSLGLKPLLNENSV